jgi:hypothetical protein
VRRLAALATFVFVLGSCYGPDASLTESGKSKPELELQFPSTTAPGATEVAELTITNPGPQAMDSLVVAFSRLGDPDLPAPVVDVAPPNGEGAVRDVSPKPRGSSPEGIIYTFEGLEDDASVTISFTLVMPTDSGAAGNAILVYDGRDPERARGVRLETEVGG